MSISLKDTANITAKSASSATSATKATQDSAGQQINTTYIKGLSVNGRTITYTKGDGSTGTITTQDTNTDTNTTYTLSKNGSTITLTGSDGKTTSVTDSNTTYSTGTTSTAGLTKLYTGVGTATDGTMTQAAMKTALDGKAASSHTHNYAGSSSAGGAANSATKLATARTINGTSFDGSANITTSKWGTARTLTLTGGATGSVSIDGSANVSLATTVNWSNISGKPTSLPANGGNADTVDNLHATAFARAHSSGHSFGGNQNAITTAQFISLLSAQGAFSQPVWISRGSWSYASNQYINDTGCGNIHLAGCTIEVIGNSTNYTIRIHTPTTSSSGVTNGDFIYVNNGTDYSPGWRRIYNNKYKPTAADVGALTQSTADGRYMRQANANGYYGMTANGDTSNWVRTTNSGIIPYQSGGASSLGTSSWPFNNIYANNIYDNGTLLEDKFLGKTATAAAATKLATARTIALSGDASGSASFDGSSNATINATIRKYCMVGSDAENSAGWYKVASQTMSGYGDSNVTFMVTSTYSNYHFGILQLQIRSDNTSITCHRLSWLSRNGLSTSNYVVNINGMTMTLYAYQPNARYGRLMFEIISESRIDGKSSGITLHNSSTKESTVPTATVTSSDGGTVANANKLTTARTINGTSFNGSANITTANWGTARTITIGNTGKSVNGSGNVSWSLSEIGAAPAGYGLGTTCQDKSNQDCNNILVTGFYMGLNMTNKPSGCTQGWIYLLVMRHNDSWVRQVAYDFSTASQVYTRVKRDGSWTAWVATDTNTWRGVQDNLTSTATDQSLSANQGKVLKGLIDGKAASNHTHSYLPLSGGTMTGAITVSGESRFHNGTYTDPWSGTSCAIKASGHVAVNGQIKATSTVTAPTFAGALSGNANTATKLATARTIKVGNTGKTFDGSDGITFTLADIGIVSGTSAPNNNDGRPDGTVYYRYA